MTTGREPLRADELAAMRARFEAIPGSVFVTTQKELSQAFMDRNRLLEDVENSREREAKLLAVVQEVAQGEPISIDEDAHGLLLVSKRVSDLQRLCEQARALVADANAGERER